jgi:hypothetical protein
MWGIKRFKKIKKFQVNRRVWPAPRIYTPTAYRARRGTRLRREPTCLRRGATPTPALGVDYADSLLQLRRGLRAVGAARHSCWLINTHLFRVWKWQFSFHGSESMWSWAKYVPQGQGRSLGRDKPGWYLIRSTATIAATQLDMLFFHFTFHFFGTGKRPVELAFLLWSSRQAKCQNLLQCLRPNNLKPLTWTGFVFRSLVLNRQGKPWRWHLWKIEGQR